jgi:hypothetical protein
MTRKRDNILSNFFILVTGDIGEYGGHPRFLRRILDRNDNDFPTPAVVHAANLRLLASILKVAINDWWQLQETGETFCDRSHVKVCKIEQFNDGQEELEEFFESAWLAFICDELSIDVSTVIDKVSLANNE